MNLPSAVLEIAESLNANMPLAAGDERFARPGWVLWIGKGSEHPAFTVVQRFRLRDDEVEPAVGEIRALLADRKRRASCWEIGWSTTPSNLEARLLSLGMKPFEEPVAAAMVLRRSLTAARFGVVVRRAETVDDYIAGSEVLTTVFGERSETREERRARAERDLAAQHAGQGAFFLGLFDGKVVAAARSTYAGEAVALSGGATLADARGRGAYRALVEARYQDAVQRGTPTLVIQAGAMSRPILERLGFETIGEIRILLDEA